MSWAVPVIKFWATEKKESVVDAVAEQADYDPNARAVRHRRKRGRRICYGTYGFLVFVQLLALRHMHGVDVLVFTGLAWMLAETAGWLAFNILDFAEVDGAYVNTSIATKFHKRPGSKLAQGNHGTSQMQTPEQIGLSDPSATAPVERKAN